ncbi:hypothetical protein [Maricaulis sp.]|uniref:hypothetical protein n=1 Tax=Maricaulis sp. TaxID=1486257 RepID=UPI0026291EA9|nr:hypothetical protein [Maricaulis sp.]
MSDPSKDKSDELIHPVARPFLWLDAPWLKSAMIWVFGVLALAFAAVDLFHHRHEYVPFAETYGFYAWWGFASFVAAVMIGWFGIRKFLGREENFWDKESHDD